MKIILYHGSEVEVERPLLDRCKTNNDYGRGFYCTDDLELSKEWACKRGNNGYSNQYVLDLDGLKILDLTDDDHGTLDWITVLIENRTFPIDPDSLATESRSFLIENHHIDLVDYDIVIGFRADDSYFSYAQTFLENGMSIESLEEAMHLGDLGIQTALISEKAIQHLSFIGSEKIVDSEYGRKFLDRDRKARDDLKNIKRSKHIGTFIIDIMRGSDEKL